MIFLTKLPDRAQIPILLKCRLLLGHLAPLLHQFHAAAQVDYVVHLLLFETFCQLPPVDFPFTFLDPLHDLRHHQLLSLHHLPHQRQFPPTSLLFLYPRQNVTAPNLIISVFSVSTLQNRQLSLKTSLTWMRSASPQRFRYLKSSAIGTHYSNLDNSRLIISTITFLRRSKTRLSFEFSTGITQDLRRNPKESSTVSSERS